MSSILTNNGAMVALQTLKSVNDDLSKTQTSISTGKEVGSAKDNSAVWAISKTMESDIAGFEAIEEGLSIGEATVAVASAGAEQIVEKLTEMKELIVSAQSENVDHEKIQTDITSKVEQITSIIDAAQFNGANLLKATVDGTATGLGVLASLDRVGAGGAVSAVEISVASVDFETDLDLGSMTQITDSASAASALGEIETYLQTAITGAASLGADAARLEDQSEFVSNLVDSMTLGVSTMTDTNMEEASARLSALQTQQDLATQSLTIANEAPSSLLQLFR
ncbi:Flagellin protein FlaA [Tritonibacter mobilis]|jgi:flagellin|uniref:flagellin N-terminal helical domain-containing protein n=1 Tax=Tritonibacter TaxID=2083206 RepID=UPI0001B8AE85|nr:MULTISPECIES: flagellin [Tritonibacter]EEW57094.1 flagellin protein [Ruegeria sp. TrichCH4B]MBW3242366.1 flagellin [Epibacterium sp. DP7N7-1]MCZ4268360.1 flagellin [Rhodobacteraceae bacterium G21628-S1]NHM20816.1 flagellin [Tritonibacter mobilis]NHM24970.1 flagellin [Tritonibacter mobilis]|eukprot:g20697.t1